MTQLNIQTEQWLDVTNPIFEADELQELLLDNAHGSVYRDSSGTRILAEHVQESLNDIQQMCKKFYSKCYGDDKTATQELLAAWNQQIQNNNLAGLVF